MHSKVNTEQAEAINRAAGLFAFIRLHPPPGE